ARPDLRLVEVNLRDHRYWWSTRLFLLAALAESFTNIQRIVVVADDAGRSFVGLVSPANLRRAFSRDAPPFGTKFVELSKSIGHRQADSPAVEDLVFQWASSRFGQVSESEFRKLVSQDWLAGILGKDFETYSRQTPKEPLTKTACAEIRAANQR